MIIYSLCIFMGIFLGYLIPRKPKIIDHFVAPEHQSVFHKYQKKVKRKPLVNDDHKAYLKERDEKNQDR